MKMKDQLFLLQPDFQNPVYPNQKFYCWHCALIEGVLVAFPERARNIDVQRVAWAHPRASVIARAGEENQTLPLLVLGEGETSKFQTGSFGNLTLIAGKDGILAALAERHGFPLPHP